MYEDDDAYFKDIAKAYQKELEILYAAGVRNVQVDDPNLACESFAPALNECQSAASLTCCGTGRLLFRGHAQRMGRRL